MTICGSQACACALTSATLAVSGNGTPGSPWVIEQAEFSDITALQVAVDNLEATAAALTSDVTALQTLTASQTTSISRLDAMEDGASAATSGTTSGSTPLTVETFTFAPLPFAGHIWVYAAAIFTKTVSTDVFSLTTRVNGATHASPSQDRSGAAAGSLATIGGPSAGSAATTPTVDMQLTRAAGTGTATVTSATLRWLFLPL
jgi:hypothetical protein